MTREESTKSETNSNVQNSNYQNKGGPDLSLGFSSFSEYLGFVCFEFRASDFGFVWAWREKVDGKLLWLASGY